MSGASGGELSDEIAQVDETREQQRARLLAEWEARIPAAARAMRDAHGPDHPHHEMWSAIADWLDFIAPHDRFEDDNSFVTKHARAVAHAYLAAQVRDAIEPEGMDCSCGGRCPDCNPPRTCIEPGCESCAGRGCPDCLRVVE